MYITEGDSSQEEGEEEATAVTVKFARPESDIAKARRLASFGHLQKMQEEESWVPLRYFNTYVSSSQNSINLEKFLRENTSTSSGSFSSKENSSTVSIKCLLNMKYLATHDHC